MYDQGEYYESDDVVEKVEGVDYYPDEQDEQELRAFAHSAGNNNHFPSSSPSSNTAGHGVATNSNSNSNRGVSPGLGVLEDFAKLSVSDKRYAVESC